MPRQTFSIEVRLRPWVRPVLHAICNMASVAEMNRDDSALRALALLTKWVCRRGTIPVLRGE